MASKKITVDLPAEVYKKLLNAIGNGAIEDMRLTARSIVVGALLKLQDRDLVECGKEVEKLFSESKKAAA